MTNSMKPHRRFAGVVKAASLPLALCCTLLAPPDALAENCRLSLSQPRIDYGSIRRDAEAQSTTVVLAVRSLSVNVLCIEPAAMALRFVGAAADGQGFRFGREGRYRLSLKNAQVDGRPVDWAVAHVSRAPASGQLLPGQAVVAHAAGRPVVGRRLTALVEIKTELPSNALAVRSEIHLEGQGSFELVSSGVPPSQ